jgi:hypothetical protein
MNERNNEFPTAQDHLNFLKYLKNRTKNIHRATEQKNE